MGGIIRISNFGLYKEGYTKEGDVIIKEGEGYHWILEKSNPPHRVYNTPLKYNRE